MLFRNQWDDHMEKHCGSLHREDLCSEDYHKERRERLFSFFHELLIKNLNPKGHHRALRKTKEFLDIWTTFENFDFKRAGVVGKQPGSRHSKRSCTKACSKMFGEFRPKLFLINEDGVGFIRLPKKGCLDMNKPLTISDFRVWDPRISICIGPNSTERKFGLSIFTSTSSLELDTFGMIPLMNWLLDILHCINKSPYTTPSRFDSFSFPREKNFAKWYIDQQDPKDGDYFGDVHDAIEKAEEKIFICDWFMTPEIYLKRPIEKYPNSRFDDTLVRAAKRGVKVCILIWQNSPVTGNNSYHTETYLEELHENIEVLRHPPLLIFFWSHHEKMVVVDGDIGFCGGIDLS